MQHREENRETDRWTSMPEKKIGQSREVRLSLSLSPIGVAFPSARQPGICLPSINTARFVQTPSELNPTALFLHNSRFLVAHS
jgi:hypothetical protein